jgi:hypothetical protein
LKWENKQRQVPLFSKQAESMHMKRRLLLSVLLFCLPFCQPLLAQAERQ